MPKISIFKGLPEKGQPHTSTESMEMIDFLNAIKYGKWKDEVIAIRNEKDKDKRSSLKKQLHSATISGTFTHRKQEAIIEHSGFICIDVDGFNDKSALINDPYTYALFTSVSASGIAIIVRIQSEKHKESFRWLQNYYYTKYGITVDPAPQNIASLRYISYDTDVFINEKSRISKTLTKQKKSQSIPVICTDEIAGQMIQECVSLGHNIAPDYDSYLRLGFALANGFGETARSWFHALCQVSEKYNSHQADRQYNHCLKGAHKSGISVGTLYWMLKNVGIHPPKSQHNNQIQIAALAKKSGRSQEAVIEQLITINNTQPDAARKIVEEVFKRDDISLKTLAADPEQLIESLVCFIKQNHSIRKNIITGKYEENGSELKRERLNYIFLRARSIFNTPNVSYDLTERIIISEFTPSFNPFDEYIDRNRHRNTTGNITALLQTIDSDTPIFQTFIRKWCLSWFAAIEGHPVRLVLALVGSQRSGKTEWFRRLLPPMLQPYYGESKLLAGKDDEILMCQKLILMDDEMGGKSTSDEKRFKELTSKSTFSLRAPYARSNEDFKRLAVLCGTSNEDQIINDLTGNTRILPIHVLSINHELYNSINKDELFMELYRAYESGEDWMLTNDEFAELAETGRKFEATPIERELIVQFFAAEPKSSNHNQHPSLMTATQIKDIIETKSRQKIMSMKRFGIELKSIFGESSPKKMSGKVMWQYPVFPIYPEDENIPNHTQMPEKEEYEPPF